VNIKYALIAGSLAVMLAATGCAGQASNRNNPARNLTNSANRAAHYNNTYGYGYDNYGDYTIDGYYVNDYVNDYANDYAQDNYSSRAGSRANDSYSHGSGYNYYSGTPNFSYNNSWETSTADTTNMAL